MSSSRLFLAILCLYPSLSFAEAPSDQLIEGFHNPPNSARPQTWWHWMNGNITKEGITADLEAMKQIGLGGATIVNVDCDVPPGPVKFMSPEWREDFKFAVQEANRLGLKLCVENCAGWSSSGGPWNTPSNAMQRVTFSETDVTGPTNFDSAQQQPPTKLNFYHDIAVLAFPALQSQAMIPDLDKKDGFKPGYQPVFSATNAGDSTNNAISGSTIVNLSNHMSSDGRLQWDVPPGRWIILRFGYTPTGATNHPPAWGGGGLECDKFSKNALDQHWNGFMQKVLDDIGPLAGKTLNCSLIDSYEVGGQNWSEHFLRDFKRLRGYDPTRFLPIFSGRVVDNPALSERFLWDIRRTIADLFAHNYYDYFTELCHEHGIKSAVEPYEGPFESLQCGASADVVMGEFWANTPIQASVKLASSVAHIYGKTIVGAESFTATPTQGRWLKTSYSLKSLGDQAYCEGLNRYIFHRYAMQPWTNRWPGMTMGQWGFNFERTVTWWNQGKPWIDYITRCQYLLQQGRAVADAAYFDGQSTPVEMRSCNPSLPPGYDYDAVNADVLLHNSTMEQGRLTLDSGANYSVLILPPADINMTPQMLESLRNLVRYGATIVGPRPLHSPSLEDYPRCDERVKAIADELWGNCDGVTIQDHRYGKGRVVWGKPLAEIFSAQKLPPDFEFAGATNETKLSYCHRVSGGAEIYFVSNQRERFDSAKCTFRVSDETPELWHPDTGIIEPAPIWREHDGRTSVDLTFDPAGSVFVLFRHSVKSADHIINTQGSVVEKLVGEQPPLWNLSCSPDGTPIIKAWTNGSSQLITAKGKTLKAIATDVPAPQEISGQWNVSFPPNWGAPPSVTLDKLISWTDHTNDGVRYFSGTATYSKDIEVPSDRLKTGRELWLDLGTVKEFAQVSINGQDFGVLWKPPFRVNITAAAKPGLNQLVVKITNLWPNRLIGDEQLPSDAQWIDTRNGPKGKNGQKLKEWPQWLLDGKSSPTGRLTFTTWRFYTKDSPLLKSGLLGPVKLETAQILKPK